MLQWLNISIHKRNVRDWKMNHWPINCRWDHFTMFTRNEGRTWTRCAFCSCLSTMTQLWNFLKMQLKPTWTNRILQSKIFWIQHSWLHFYTLTSVRYPVTIVSSTGSLICNPFYPSVHWAWTLLHFEPERW